MKFYQASKIRSLSFPELLHFLWALDVTEKNRILFASGQFQIYARMGMTEKWDTDFKKKSARSDALRGGAFSLKKRSLP